MCVGGVVLAKPPALQEARRVLLQHAQPHPNTRRLALAGSLPHVGPGLRQGARGLHFLLGVFLWGFGGEGGKEGGGRGVNHFRNFNSDLYKEN